jgi:Ser/Thr protein kinase RdoA (MazF antagonist)
MQHVAEAAVSKWPLRPLRIELAAHRENAVFRVDAEEGVFALRLHRQGYRSDVELQSEMHFMAALAKSGIAVPRPIVSNAANIVEHIADVQASVLTWLSGRSLGKSGVPLDIPDRVFTFERFGNLIARMHDVTDQWQRPQTFQRQSWDIEGLLGDAPQWGRFWENPRLTSEQQKILIAVRSKLRHELSSQPFDMGLIHADLVSENILVDGSDLRIIDFDDSGYGFRLQDLATALVKHEAEADFESLKQALLRGYQTLRPLDAVKVDLFLFIRHLTYVGWVVPRMEDADGLKRCDNYIANAIRKAEVYLSPKT